MELTYLQVINLLLGKVEANYMDASWKTRAQERFQKAVVQMIKEGDFTDEEVTGLTITTTIHPVNKTAYKVYGGMPVEVVIPDPPPEPPEDPPADLIVLAILRLDDADDVFHFRPVEYDEYRKRCQLTSLNIDGRTQYYTTKGPYLYIVGKIPLANVVMADDVVVTAANNNVELVYIRDLPAWSDADVITDELAFSFLYRAIDRAAAELLEILQRSA